MHVALLRKGDPSGEEHEGIRKKWSVYIDSYTLNAPTEKLPKTTKAEVLVPPQASSS